MSSNKVLLIFIAILLITGVASAGEVTRTISINTTFKNDTSSMINVSLTTSSSNFSFYELNETFPTNVTITTRNANISIVINGVMTNTSAAYTFNASGLVQFYGGLNGALNNTPFNYSIKPHENTASVYKGNITGSYRDFDLNSGTTGNTTITIIGSDLTFPEKLRYFDTDGNNIINKGEVFNAIAVGYFGYNQASVPIMSLSEIMGLIVNYYFSGRQIV